MTKARNRIRIRNRREKEANSLQWNSLDSADKISMCVSLIKHRDWLFELAEECRSKKRSESGAK